MDFEDDVDTIYIDKDFGFATVQEVLDHCSSSGGDSAIDLSKNGDDFPRIVLYGLDDYNKLANDSSWSDYSYSSCPFGHLQKSPGTRPRRPRTAAGGTASDDFVDP